ncbi:MAG: hypothetical protein ACPH5P_00160 [Akkermansiaceae bacterium]
MKTHSDARKQLEQAVDNIYWCLVDYVETCHDSDKAAAAQIDEDWEKVCQIINQTVNWSAPA